MKQKTKTNPLKQMLDDALVQYGYSRQGQAEAMGVHQNTVRAWRLGREPQAAGWHKLGLYFQMDPVKLKALVTAGWTA